MKYPINKKDVRVLVVDDSSSVLTYMSNLLMAQGFTCVETADNSKSALQVVKTIDGCPFDLVFLDRYIGEDCGVELLKKIRSFDKQVPIIMITQEDGGAKVIEAISAGANDYIVKPFCMETVSGKIEKLLALTE